jgi:hypothetical protein
MESAIAPIPFASKVQLLLLPAVSFGLKIQNGLTKICIPGKIASSGQGNLVQYSNGQLGK